jgi:tRNA(Ile)-lysidine synthase
MDEAAVKIPTRVAVAVKLHQVFTPGERVVVAVSGGPDSLALLSILREILPALPLHLTVAHFDHGWRVDSRNDLEFVADLSERWGFVFQSERAPESTPHTEEAARTARYAFLRRVAAGTQSSAIALGHTQDDQVETLLLHLLRGAGSRGLAGMRRRDGDLARPLLDLRRSELEAYLSRLGLTPRRDPSNDDPRFTRNRLRQQLMPAIDRFDPSARDLLARTADILAEEDRYLEDAVAQLDPQAATDPERFRRLPSALQRRLVRTLIPNAGFPHTEAFRLQGDLPPSGATPAEGGTAQLRAVACSCDPATFKARDSIGHLDAELVRPPLHVVSRQPGARMRPLGMLESKRVQDILVDARVPRHLRNSLPIVCDAEEIVWIPGVTISETKRVTDRTRSQLHLEILSR